MGLQAPNSNSSFYNRVSINFFVSINARSYPTSRYGQRNTLVFSARSKALIETVKEEYSLQVVYKDSAACLQFAKFQSCLPVLIYISLTYHWFMSKYSSLEFDSSLFCGSTCRSVYYRALFKKSYRNYK